MDLLNSREVYSEVDQSGMLRLLMEFYQQFDTGVKLAREVDLTSFAGYEIYNIVLCGMGGSAIGGDLLRAYLFDELPVPMYINRDYDIPGFVDEHTLLIGSSYSGNTEETISAFVEAKNRGALLFAISTGGELIRLANSFGVPYIEIPSGLPPRTALGYSFVPLLGLFIRLGYARDHWADIKSTARLLRKGAEKFSPSVPDNPAKKLASRIFGKLPLIYSSTRYFDVVGTRFRGQINENAKMLAYSSLLPEMNHNELVGWRHLFEFGKHLAPVFLTDRDDNPRVRYRMKLTSGVMEELGIEPIFLESEGKSLLERIFSLVQLGDFTSYYLAILAREDPGPVKVIDYLKSRLKEFKG
ncbi:bifunctional phosphoglucose/phosphomannose isomerase [bacterium]|nr:bifunctional phosphoglucose/phosphomannose isomerase [bacterium]